MFARVNYYLGYINARNNLRVSTDKNISHFLEQSLKLENAYSDFLKMLSSSTFVSSWELENLCAKPVAKQLDEIDNHIKSSELKFNTRAYDNLVSILEILRTDCNNILITTETTKYFEKDIIRRHQAFCPTSEENGIIDKMFVELRKPAETAQIRQLELYFVMLDFIFPSLGAIKAQVQASTLELNHQPIPFSMQEESELLNKLIKERNLYNLQPPRMPFTLAVIKEMASRDINESGELDSRIEDSIWADLLVRSMHLTMLGNPHEVEQLVQCGFLKPKAPMLIRKEKETLVDKFESER